METVISDNKGDTGSVKILRNRIQEELEAGNTVKIKLLQPGVMYQKDGAWKTVIDFMNEWAIGGPSHHCAIGVGHIGDKLEKLSKILGIESHWLK